MNAALDAALAYAARGWPVFPCAPRRKEPLIPKAEGGNGVLDATTDETQIRAWWTQTPDANIGIATGHPGPDVADFDTYGNDIAIAAFSKLTKADILTGHGNMIRTRSGGLHLYYKGTTQRNGRILGQHVDFRSQGGYVIAPPSFVEADDKGPAGYYQLLSADDATAELDWRIVKDLLDPPPLFQQPPAERTALEATGRPGDDFATRTSWTQILEPAGWTLMRELGDGVRYWRRPGKAGRGVSASTRDNGGLWVFTTSTEFEPEQLYSKFAAWALLSSYGRDYTAAAAALRAQGYGDQPATLAALQQPEDATGHTSWYPRDLEPVLDGDQSADPPPAFLSRTDGRCLLYRGKINAFIGESESGKTWAALVAVAQAIADHRQVLYLDFEDVATGITYRLRCLGATRDQLAKQFRYIAPDEQLTTAAAVDLHAAITETVPDLVIVDGVNAAMTLLGYNLIDNKDATEFSQRLLRPLKRTGAAVLTIDHVTKVRENRGSYAIGAQSKRADIDGAAYIIEAVKKFGRGQQGKLKLTVSKDRPGHVRAIAAGATYAGTLTLTSNADLSITAELREPDMRPPEEKDPWRPTWLMQKVSEFLETIAGGATKSQVEKAIDKRADHVRAAIDRLAAEGYIALESGPRNAIVCRTVRPYRESNDLVPLVPTSSDLVPDEDSDASMTSSRTSSHPVYIGRGDEVDEVAQAEPVCTRCGEYHHRYGPQGRPCFQQPVRAS